MSRISAILPADATGKVKTLLDGVQKTIGMTPNLYRVAAQSPASLEGLLTLTGLLGHGALPAPLREQIALTIAEANGCDYCLSAHSLLGKKAGLSDADVAQAREGRAADAKSAAALRFVASVVADRGQVSDGDIAAVRAAGYTEGDIVELVAQTVLNIFTNTLNNVARTDIDFPAVRPAARQAA